MGLLPPSPFLALPHALAAPPRQPWSVEPFEGSELTLALIAAYAEQRLLPLVMESAKHYRGDAARTAALARGSQHLSAAMAAEVGRTCTLIPSAVARFKDALQGCVSLRVSHGAALSMPAWEVLTSLPEGAMTAMPLVSALVDSYEQGLMEVHRMKRMVQETSAAAAADALSPQLVWLDELYRARRAGYHVAMRMHTLLANARCAPLASFLDAAESMLRVGLSVFGTVSGALEYRQAWVLQLLAAPARGSRQAEEDAEAAAAAHTLLYVTPAWLRARESENAQAEHAA